MIFATAFDVIEQRVQVLRKGMQSETVRKTGLLCAVAVFLVGTIVAGRQVSLPSEGIRWAPFYLLVFVGIPATILLNALEMELSGRLLGRRFGVWRALSTTIIASAANMLPLPGAALVRMAGLTGLGATVRESGKVTLALAILWLGIAFILTGLFLVGEHGLMGATSLVVGGIATVTALWGLLRVSGRVSLALWCLVVRCAMVLVAVVRLLLCFQMIGVAASFHQTMVFSVSGVFGSAVSIVPAGLGVRELTSAALAPLAGIEPAGAFLATAGDRFVELVVLLVLAVPLALLSPAIWTKVRSGERSARSQSI